MPYQITLRIIHVVLNIFGFLKKLFLCKTTKIMIKKFIGNHPLEFMQTQKQEKECFF